jgi:hypothetical protein
MVVEGVVRDGKIELIDGPELADGQRVQVVIEPRGVPDEPVAIGPTSAPEEGTVHTPLEDPKLIERLAGIRHDLPPLPSGPRAGAKVCRRNAE